MPNRWETSRIADQRYSESGMISRAFHHGDPGMAQFAQMREREFGGHGVVEDQIADARGAGMARDGDYRQRAEEIGLGVQQQKSVDRALDHAARVFADQLGVPVMAGGKVKIMGFDQRRLHAVHDHGEIAFAEVGGEHGNRHASALAQGAGKVVWPVIEFPGGLKDPLAGLGGNRPGGRRVVEHQRNGSLREFEQRG